MSNIETIVPLDGYLEITYGGNVKRGFPEMHRIAQQILAACEKHQCWHILENYTDVDYEHGSDILAEHRLAEMLTQPEFAAIEWALLLPKSSHNTETHLENAAQNRGVRLRTFLNRHEAIKWLINDSRIPNTRPAG